MADEVLTEILQILLQRTEQNDVEWRASESGSLAFEVDFEKATAVIDSIDGDAAAPFRLSIYRHGEEPAYQRYLAHLEQESDVDSMQWSHADLERLYRLARNRALGVDSTLYELLQELRGGSATDR